jgi:tetratricopeptide (TPR) repeat protein
LLRHLFDFRELQRNELSAAFLAGLPRSESIAGRHDKVVAWVHGAVEKLAFAGGHKARVQAEILRRCDLLGEAHATVWTELGLSRRTFYNQRRDALTRLAIVLKGSLPNATVEVQSKLDAFELRLASARSLEDAGYWELAVRESEELARSARTPAQHVRAGAMALETDCLYGRLERVRHRLSALEAQVDVLPIGSTHNAAAFLAASTACAFARRNLGESTQALERLSSVRRALELRPKLLEERSVADAWAKALLHLAEFHAIAGSASHALEALDEASAVLARLPDADPDTCARLAVNRAEVVLSLDRPFAEAEVSAQTALSVAQRFGLLSRAVEAATALCLIQAVSGNRCAALNTGKPALPLADRLQPHQSGVFLRLILARVYAEEGSIQASRRLFDQASRSIPALSAIGAFREATAASIELSNGEFTAGLQRSQQAADAAQRSGFGRTTGAALALQARALRGLGRSRAAASAADAAVAILESTGTRYALAAAYDLSGQLTGNRHHAQLATELRAILRGPAQAALHRRRGGSVRPGGHQHH